MGFLPIEDFLLVQKMKILGFHSQNLWKINPKRNWNNVLFADESKLNIFVSDGHIIVWRRKNEELNPKNLVGTVKHAGGSVLLRGCVSGSDASFPKIWCFENSD